LAEEKKISLPRVWRLFYTFGRLKRDYRDRKDQSERLERILKRAVADFQVMPYLDVAVRWADYLTRKEGKS